MFMDFLLSKDVMWLPSQADSWYQFSKLLSFVSCNPDPLISGESKSPQQGSVRRKKAPQASALAASLYTPLHPLQNSFSQTQVHWHQKIDPILVHIFLYSILCISLDSGRIPVHVFQVRVPSICQINPSGTSSPPIRHRASFQIKMPHMHTRVLHASASYSFVPFLVSCKFNKMVLRSGLLSETCLSLPSVNVSVV